MNPNWTDKLRDKMDGYTEPVPEELWSSLETRFGAGFMANQKVSDTVPAIENPENAAKSAKTSHDKKTILFWWKAVAAAAAFAAVVTGIFLINPSKNGDLEKLEVVNKNVIANNNIVPQDDNKEIIDNLTVNMISEAKTMRVKPGKPQEAPVTVQVDGLPLETASSYDISDTKKEPVKSEEKRSENAREKYLSPEENSDNWNRYLAEAMTKEKRKARGVTVSPSVHIGGINGSSSSTSVDGNFVMGANPLVQEYRVSAAGTPLAKTYEDCYNRGLDMKARHNFPVSAGLGVKIGFGERFGLSTGVTYSYLHSTFTPESGAEASAGVEFRQDAHFIGIPVSLSYNFLNINGFSLYGSAGGMLELNLKSSVRRDGPATAIATATRADSDTFSSVSKSSQSYTNTTHKPYWSVNLAAGAQYGLTKNLAIYLEPAAVLHLSPYANASGSLRTAYTAHPLSFRLSVGLRLEL